MKTIYALGELQLVLKLQETPKPERKKNEV